jgi:hypothetical protein
VSIILKRKMSSEQEVRANLAAIGSLPNLDNRVAAYKDLLQTATTSKNVQSIRVILEHCNIIPLLIHCN